MTKEPYTKIKGQISIPIAVFLAGITMIGSIISAYYIPQTKISVIEERESNHYEEVQKRLETMDKKLDLLLEANIVKTIK